MMTTNLFAFANVKQLRTGCSFRILLPFFRTSWGFGFLNSAIFNSFHNLVEFGTILRDFGISGGGGFNPPNPLGMPLLMIKSSRMRCAKHVERMGKREMQGLVRRPEGKKPLSRPRCG